MAIGGEHTYATKKIGMLRLRCFIVRYYCRRRYEHLAVALAIGEV